MPSDSLLGMMNTLYRKIRMWFFNCHFKWESSQPSIQYLPKPFDFISKINFKKVTIIKNYLRGSDQCKEIEESSRMGKTRDLFKKIWDTKGTFHAEMVTIKDKNCMDLTEVEEIKNRWKEYTELYKKDLHYPNNHDGVITHLEPDILKCEVKWVIGNITMSKASRPDGVPVEPFQIWKDDDGKVLNSITSKFVKLSNGHRTGKGQFSFQTQRRAMPKNVQTIEQLHSSHMLAKWCSTFSKTDFNSLWTMNFQTFKLALEKVEKPEIKCPKSVGSSKNQETSRKTSISALLIMPKPLTVWITKKHGKFFKRWVYQTTWPAAWETCMQVREQ